MDIVRFLHLELFAFNTDFPAEGIYKNLFNLRCHCRFLYLAL